MELIRLQSVVKEYGSKTARTKVLDKVDLTIYSGEFICLFGRSGCGKTTLLNILGLIDSSTGGEYYFKGRNVKELSSREIAVKRNQEIGFIYQSFHLLDDYNVIDNVSLPMGYAGIKRKKRKEYAEKLLRDVGMGERMKFYSRQLSGGEKQRAAIARALSNRPGLILADEPTGSLDEKNGTAVMEILKELNESGITIIMVTHDQSLKEYASRVIHISDGKIIQVQ